MRSPCSDRAVVVQAIATCRAVRQTRGLLDRFASCLRQRRLGGVALAAAHLRRQYRRGARWSILRRSSPIIQSYRERRAQPTKPPARAPGHAPGRAPAVHRKRSRCPYARPRSAASPGRAPPRAAGGGGGSQGWGRRPQPGEGGGGDGRAEASPCPRSEEAGEWVGSC